MVTWSTLAIIRVQLPTWESSIILLVENREEDLDDAFPPDPQVNLPDEQVKPTSNKTVPPSSPSISNFMDLTKYSTLSKLLRVTSYVLRFIHNTRNPSDQRKGPLTVRELRSSRRKWIVDRQHHHYATELASISSPTKSRPPLTRQLRLFIDDNSLLRCGGRIHNAPVTDAAKFPILLPKKDHITTRVKTHKLLQVCKQVVTSLFTSCQQVVFALLVPSLL